MVAVVLGGFAVKFSKQEKTVSVSGFNYSIGGISSSTGKDVESKLSMYTRNYGNVDGMEIKVKDDATITYKVAFYDEDKAFVDMSDALDEDFDISDLPEGAEYFRVVITPNQVDGEDVKVSIFTILHYANMLTITYNK